MTLTYFTARSTYVAHAFEWGKLLKCHLKGKTCRKWANGLKVGNSEKKLDPRGWSAPTPGQYTCILQKYSKIFFSDTTWPIKAIYGRKHLWEGGTIVFINNPGHMIKMAAMTIYGKNPLKFFFFSTNGPISTKFGMKHWGLKYYNVFINYDLWMTLTYFTARST